MIEQFKTNNFYLAAYLICNDLAMVNIDATDKKKSIFIFDLNVELGELVKKDELVRNFLYGREALVDARRFSSTLKELKNKIYSET